MSLGVSSFTQMVYQNIAYNSSFLLETEREETLPLYPKGGYKNNHPQDWGFGNSRCKLTYIGWINNKVLLYSYTGNYVQYPVINRNGKEYEKVYSYMGFPGSSADQESAYNARDSSLIPGSGRSPEAGKATHSSVLGLPWWLRW